MNKKNIGSSFDRWLREEGIQEEVTAGAIKRVLARQVQAAMSEGGLSMAEMARRMQTKPLSTGLFAGPRKRIRHFVNAPEGGCRHRPRGERLELV